MNDHKHLSAKDVMTTPIILFQHADPILKVERALVERNISGAPVMKNGAMAGIISRSDFVRMPVLLDSLDGYLAEEMRGVPEATFDKITPFHERFPTLTAEDMMTSQVLTCGASTPVNEIAALMIKNHVHRIVVTDEQGPIGMVESLDLVKLISG